MKGLGIVSSPRQKNTYNIVKTGFDYEVILLRNKNIKACNDCRNCHATFKCKIKMEMFG